MAAIAAGAVLCALPLRAGEPDGVDWRSSTDYDVFRAMQGRYAGLTVLAPSGAPGVETAAVLRGYSLNGESPLIIVDGLRVDNLANIDPSTVESVELLKDAEPVKHWQRLRLHVGTADTLARISLLDKELIRPGETAAAQLITEEPVVTSMKSCFILRTYSPLVTVAGGQILMPAGERPKSKHEKTALIKFLDTLASEPPLKERILALIDYREIITAAEAARMNEITVTELMRAISSCEAKGEIGIARGADATLISGDKLKELADTLRLALEKFHKEHPERKGMPCDECAKAIAGGDAKFARELLALLAKRELIKFEDDRAALPEFEPFDEDAFASDVAALRSFALKKDFSMPTLDEAQDALGYSPEQMKRIISYLRERKGVAIVTGGFLLFPEIEAAFMDKISSIEGDITLAAVRDATGSSRKYALPLLEYFDSKGVTRRVGDKRILMKK